MNSGKNSSLNIPESQKPRIVIIGGGFGGIHFLRKIKKENYQIVVIDRFNYHTFQPLLYQVATAGLEPDSIAGPLRKLLKKNPAIYFRMAKVYRVIPADKMIETSAGSIGYDYLVIATGSKINFFGNKDIAQNSFPLKQVTHALDLRSHIFQQFEELELVNDNEKAERLRTFVVVGAGPTGVEVCGALAELKKHVLPHDYPELDIDKVNIFLVEGLDSVLPAMSEKSGKKAKNYLEKMGVKIMLNSMIESYDGKTARLNTGENISTETLIWAAGVKGNIPNGFPKESIGNKKLKVNRFNQVTKSNDGSSVYNNIFAIGDVAFMQTARYQQGVPGLAQAAIQQGKQVAKNFNKWARNKSPEEFRYKNKGVLATVGRNKAIADLPRNIKIFGLAGWLVWMIVHLLFLVGFRNKAIVFANWAWNYVTYDRGIRLILRPSSKKHSKIKEEMISEMNEAGE